MKSVLVIIFSGMLLISCGDSSLPPGEKAAEGSTGEKAGTTLDTTSRSQNTQKDSSAQKNNY